MPFAAWVWAGARPSRRGQRLAPPVRRGQCVQWSIFVRQHHSDGGLRIVDVQRAAGRDQLHQTRGAVVKNARDMALVHLLRAGLMNLISTTEELASACSRLAAHPFVTVDTEFLRETTYYPKLCLIQIASPDEAVMVDPLADGAQSRVSISLTGQTSPGLVGMLEKRLNPLVLRRVLAQELELLDNYVRTRQPSP